MFGGGGLVVECLPVYGGSVHPGSESGARARAGARGGPERMKSSEYMGRGLCFFGCGAIRWWWAGAFERR
jgi:hypothetical protein